MQNKNNKLRSRLILKIKKDTKIKWKIIRTNADIPFKSSKNEIAIKLIVTNERQNVLIIGSTIKSDTNQNIKIIIINITPPILGFASSCKDLLFGMSCILGNNFKNKIEEIAKIVEINEENNSKKKIGSSKIITQPS